MLTLSSFNQHGSLEKTAGLQPFNHTKSSAIVFAKTTSELFLLADPGNKIEQFIGIGWFF